ncbi:hypothetical protein ABK040_005904 [Willaertia magna]
MLKKALKRCSSKISTKNNNFSFIPFGKYFIKNNNNKINSFINNNYTCQYFNISLSNNNVTINKQDEISKEIFQYESEILYFFTQREKINYSPELKNKYETIVLKLLNINIPKNITLQQSSYFISLFLIECLQLFELENDREFILEKAFEILKISKILTNNEKSQHLSLFIHIATLMKNLNLMNETFNNYFEFIQECLQKYRKNTNLQLPLQIDDIVIAFSCSPHIGKYSEMILLGDLIVNYFKGDSILSVLNDDANTEQQIDYSAIYKLLKAYTINNQLLPFIDLNNNSILQQYKVTSLTMKIESINFNSGMHDENVQITQEGNVIDSNTFPELLEFDIHRWGNVVLWFQQVVLSGIISDNKVYLYGYSNVEGIDDKTSSEGGRHGDMSVFLKETYELLTDEEDKERVRKLIEEGKEELASEVLDCVIETQFILENTNSKGDPFSNASSNTTNNTTIIDSSIVDKNPTNSENLVIEGKKMNEQDSTSVMRWTGTHKRTVTEKRLHNVTTRLVITYSIEMTLANI